jgi:hypothetical protein
MFPGWCIKFFTASTTTMRPFFCKEVVLKTPAHFTGFLIVLITIPSIRLNQNTVQKPGAGIKLNTECKLPRNIINSQFSTNRKTNKNVHAATSTPAVL